MWFDGRDADGRCRPFWILGAVPHSTYPGRRRIRQRTDARAGSASYAARVSESLRSRGDHGPVNASLRPTTTDVILAVLVAVAIALASAAKVEPEALDPDVWSYLFAVALGALMLVRRRWPAGVLVATLLLLAGYYTLGYPAVGVAVPIAGAAFSAAEQGRLRLAVAVSALVVVVATGYRLSEEPVLRLLGFELAQNLILLVAVIALGDSVRSRRDLRRESQRRAEQARLDHERDTRELLEQERLRIAREVHDVIAHSVSAISIQSVVGLEALPAEPDNAAAALRNIRSVSSKALTDLRGAVGVLRDSAGPAAEPVGGLADLGRLVESAAAGGLAITVTSSGTPGEVPLVVDAAAYRTVQESITNVLKHSSSSTALVQIDHRADRIELLVRNPVAAQPIPVTAGRSASPGNGFGITGMRERAELLGGTASAIPTADGGFEVRATLPFPAR